MKIFFDTEFTGLKQNTRLLSIGMVTEEGKEFYAEFGTPSGLVGMYEVNDWIKENVIANFTRDPKDGFINEAHLTKKIEEFIETYDKIEMWSDCLAYDWVLFNELWGGAFSIPMNIYYIPFDLSTAFKLKGVDPDVNREEYSLMEGKKHNALHDAKVIKACYERLIGL